MVNKPKKGMNFMNYNSSRYLFNLDDVSIVKYTQMFSPLNILHFDSRTSFLYNPMFTTYQHEKRPDLILTTGDHRCLDTYVLFFIIGFCFFVFATEKRRSLNRPLRYSPHVGCNHRFVRTPGHGNATAASVADANSNSAF